MRKHYFFLIVLYCAGIFWLSHQSEINDGALDFPGKDKIAHIVLYGGLGLLAGWGRYRSKPTASWFSMHGWPVVFAALYGITDEIHQYFVPNRSADPLDWAADVFGALLAQVFLYGVIRRWRSGAKLQETVYEPQG